MNDYLRNAVIDLRKQRIKYKEIAEYLEISQSSFWSWLHGYYDFGVEKQQLLYDIISNLKE